METPQPLAEWAEQMAETLQQKAQVKEQRHQAGLMNQTQAETVWVKGMDQVIHTLEILVQALKHTGHFPHLTLLSHARSPQGTSTYMRRGTLLSLKGLEWESQTIEFEIHIASPFRPDILAPAVRVITKSDTGRDTGPRQEQFCFGVSVQGTVVWQLTNPSLVMPQEGSVEEMLRGFLTALLLLE
jgi:hypothetical protein